MAGGRGQQKVVGSSAQVVSADHPPTGRGHQQGGEGWVIKEKTRPGGDRTPEAQLPTSGHPCPNAEATGHPGGEERLQNCEQTAGAGGGGGELP